MKITMRTVIFTLIIIFCIFAINFGVYWQFFRNANTNTIEPEMPITSSNTEQLEKNFKNIFENKLDYQGNNVNTIGITKKDSTKDLIYTWMTGEKVVENAYDLKIDIPRVNISNTAVEKFNEKIKGLYIDKAYDVMNNATNNTIYTVEYMGYVNTNILSLVIKSTLKDKNNPQRVIIQTYNYNLSTNEEITFAQMLEIKGLQESTVKSTISEKIQKANAEAQKLKNLGYNVYIRDLSSNIYELQNTANFMLGPDNNLYIIYPYGNNNFTDEMDVIVFE